MTEPNEKPSSSLCLPLVLDIQPATVDIMDADGAVLACGASVTERDWYVGIFTHIIHACNRYPHVLARLGAAEAVLRKAREALNAALIINGGSHRQNVNREIDEYLKLEKPDA